MMLSRHLLSRALFILLACICLGIAFWIGLTFLEPVPIPSVPASRRTVQFDPSVDVSRNELFRQLESLGVATLEAGAASGRINPFVPVLYATSSMTSVLPSTSTTQP